MQIEIEDNPNCPGSDQMVYQEIGPDRPVRAILVTLHGRDVACDVTAVRKTGAFAPAFACKINDSSDGVAYLIHGGEWGIRIRPPQFSAEAWDLGNKNQWGEPYKIYSEKDIVWAD